MNFDIKDVKSWANRHDVKVGDKGYFGDSLEALRRGKLKSVVTGFNEELGYPFCCYDGGVNFTFFLPLDAVKEDKPKEKKYRPFKTTQELLDVVRGKDWQYGISTDSEITIRRKGEHNHRINELIIEIEFQKDQSGGQEILHALNYCPMSYWFENYEIMNNKGEWVPFGVEVEDEY